MQLVLADIRSLILTACEPALAEHGMAPQAAPDDFDLRASGIVDSLGFVELVVALEEELEIDLDLDGLDPEEITVLGPFTRHVHSQALAASRGSDEI